MESRKTSRDSKQVNAIETASMRLNRHILCDIDQQKPLLPALH
jgi:hypothetical protein